MTVQFCRHWCWRNWSFGWHKPIVVQAWANYRKGAKPAQLQEVWVWHWGPFYVCKTRRWELIYGSWQSGQGR